MKIAPRTDRLLSQVSPYHLIIIGSCSSFLPTPPKYMNVLNRLKDGAYFCYCAYVLRISRYSDFLLVIPITTRTFLRGLELCGESRTLQVLLVSKKIIGGNHAFFKDNKALIWSYRHTWVCILLLFLNYCCLIISEK